MGGQRLGLRLWSTFAQTPEGRSEPTCRARRPAERGTTLGSIATAGHAEVSIKNIHIEWNNAGINRSDGSRAACDFEVRGVRNDMIGGRHRVARVLRPHSQEPRDAVRRGASRVSHALGSAAGRRVRDS